jgi:hypothetical protein
MKDMGFWLSFAGTLDAGRKNAPVKASASRLRKEDGMVISRIRAFAGKSSIPLSQAA